MEVKKFKNLNKRYKDFLEKIIIKDINDKNFSKLHSEISTLALNNDIQFSDLSNIILNYDGPENEKINFIKSINKIKNNFIIESFLNHEKLKETISDFKKKYYKDHSKKTILYALKKLFLKYFKVWNYLNSIVEINKNKLTLNIINPDDYVFLNKLIIV